MGLEYLPAEQRDIALQALKWGTANLSEKIELFQMNAKYRQLYLNLPLPKQSHLFSKHRRDDLFNLFQQIDEKLQIEALTLMDSDMIVELLNYAGNGSTCRQILKKMDPDYSIDILQKISQPLRLSIFRHLKNKERVIMKITEKQTLLKNSRTTHKKARYIATEEFLLGFPEPLRRCSVCRKNYGDGEEFQFGGCGKHTFCSKCSFDAHCPCNPRIGFGTFGQAGASSPSAPPSLY